MFETLFKIIPNTPHREDVPISLNLSFENWNFKAPLRFVVESGEVSDSGTSCYTNPESETIDVAGQLITKKLVKQLEKFRYFLWCLMKVLPPVWYGFSCMEHIVEVLLRQCQLVRWGIRFRDVPPNPIPRFLEYPLPQCQKYRMDILPRTAISSKFKFVFFLFVLNSLRLNGEA